MRHLISLLTLFLFASAAHAVPIQVEFSGAVADAFGDFEVGDLVIGSLRYESSAALTTDGDPLEFANGIIDFRIEIGGFTYEMVGSGTIRIFGGDTISFQTQAGAVSGEPMTFDPDFFGVTLAGADFPLTTLPTSFDESNFSSATFALGFDPAAGPSGLLSRVSAVAVSEPPTLVLLAIGLFGLACAAEAKRKSVSKLTCDI